MAAKAGGCLLRGEDKAARAAGFGSLEAVVRGAGIDIDDLMREDAESCMDAVYAARKAFAFVFADDNRADHQSSLLMHNML